MRIIIQTEKNPPIFQKYGFFTVLELATRQLFCGYCCPRCNCPLRKKQELCDNCGMFLDWRTIYETTNKSEQKKQRKINKNKKRKSKKVS